MAQLDGEPAQEIATAVGTLSPAQRSVLGLHLDGLSYAQIADRTQDSLPAIRSHLFRARRALATVIGRPPPLRPAGHRLPETTAGPGRSRPARHAAGRRSGPTTRNAPATLMSRPDPGPPDRPGLKPAGSA